MSRQCTSHLHASTLTRHFARTNRTKRVLLLTLLVKGRLNNALVVRGEVGQQVRLEADPRKRRQRAVEPFQLITTTRC
jgi:hypothetical protein